MQLSSSHSRGGTAALSDDAQRRRNFEPNLFSNEGENDRVASKRRRRHRDCETDQGEEDSLSRLESVRKIHAAGAVVPIKESQSTRQSRIRTSDPIPMLHFQFLGFNGIRSRRPNPQEQQHISTIEMNSETPAIALVHSPVNYTFPAQNQELSGPEHSDQAPPGLSQEVPQRVPQRVSQRVPHRVSQRTSQRASQRAPQRPLQRTSSDHDQNGDTHRAPIHTHSHTHFHRHNYSHVDPHTYIEGPHMHAHFHTHDNHYRGRSYRPSLYGAPAMHSVATLSVIPQIQQVPLLGQSRSSDRSMPEEEEETVSRETHRFVYIDHDHFTNPLPLPPPISVTDGVPAAAAAGSAAAVTASDMSWLEQREFQEAQNRSLDESYAANRLSGLTAANLLPPLPSRPSPEGYTTSFQSVLEDTIVCTSCSTPLQESVLLRVCGHLYCVKCSKTHADCQAPHCKKHTVVDQQLFREIFL